MASLYEQGLEIDLISVKKEYQRMGFGQEGIETSTCWANSIAGYLAELMACGTLYNRLGQKCLILLQLAFKRYLWQLGARIMQQAGDPTTDALALIDQGREWFDKMLEDIQSIGEKNALSYLTAVLNQIEQQQLSPESLAGLATGIIALDKLTAGLKASNLIVLAARPAMGKSAVALFIIRHITLTLDLPVGLVTLEMSGQEVMQRLVAMETGYSNFQLDRADCDLATVHRKVGRLSRIPLHIHDKPITLTELRLKAFDWKRRHKIGLLILDYLQLVEVVGAKTETEQVSKVSRVLKELASELGIPVLALSQLNRESETRKDFDKRPMLSDLRQSGQIEQDANAIWFLFRPHYYGLNYPDGSATDQTLEIHVAKSRNGPTTERDNPLLVRYDKAINMLYDYQFNGFRPLSQDQVDF